MVKVTHYGERIHEKEFSEELKVRDFLQQCEIALTANATVSVNSAKADLDDPVSDNSVITVAQKVANG